MKIYLPFLLLFLFVSHNLFCQNSTAENDAIVRRMTNRLKGKKQRTKHVKALEDALMAANENDLTKYDKWRSELGLEALENAYKYAKKIDKRQGRVEPLLPLVSDDGYRPIIKLIPAKEMMEEVHGNIIDYYLEIINEDLIAANEGQKLKARSAFSSIKRAKRKYDWNTEEAQILQDSAYALGRYYVLLEMKNNTFMDGNTVIRKMSWNGISTNNGWQIIHLSKRDGIDYDFFAQLLITDADVSSDDKDEEDYEVSVEVEVKKATDTEEAKYETVSAEVTDVVMHKEAEVDATLIVKNIEGNIVYKDWFTVESVFHDEYCTYDGDERALDGRDCDTFTLGHRFPFDSDLLDECAEKLEDIVSCELARVDVRE